jgi:hypothetical protein
LKNNFAAGDKIVEAKSGSPYVYALGFIARNGTHKLLLINKRNRDIDLTLPQAAKQIVFVNQDTKGDPPKKQNVSTNRIALKGFEVAAVSF